MPLNEKTIANLLQTGLERKKTDDIMDELIRDEEFRAMLLKKLMNLNKDNMNRY